MNYLENLKLKVIFSGKRMTSPLLKVIFRIVKLTCFREKITI